MEINIIETINLAEGANLDIWIQAFLLVVLFIYSVFSILVNRQVKILNENIQTIKADFLSKIAFYHLISSVGLLFFVLIAITIEIL